MEANPVGVPQVEKIQDYVDEVIAWWKEHHPDAGSWWKKVSVPWMEVVNFLTRASDYFIRAVDNLIENGPDKKATVMKALSDVYDMIVPGLLPIYLRPFNTKIKSFIFDVVLSLTIDFVVEKYRKNEWHAEAKLKFA